MLREACIVALSSVHYCPLLLVMTDVLVSLSIIEVAQNPQNYTSSAYFQSGLCICKITDYYYYQVKNSPFLAFIVPWQTDLS